ncbi:phosphodiester glycosidase family protein [Candidatus Woesebacteria bacterium]|nr:phosphodiester glycosidase family protein [Candidatus Woesebacteria bacterium]
MKVRVVKHVARYLFLSIVALVSIFGFTMYLQIRSRADSENRLSSNIKKIQSDYDKLKKEDQRVRNDTLEEEIKNIQKTYKDTVSTYENLLKLRDQNVKIPELEKDLAGILRSLSDRDYSSASGNLVALQKNIDKKNAEIAAAFVIPANVPANNTPPGAGYSRQSVNSEVGSFLVDIIAADLNSTRVVVDTASDGSCGNDCPVDALGNFAARSGAFAGINGPYFCPASYPGCAGKTNSFDTLLMNKNKTYFNSDNNVYSTVPAVIFSGSSGRFVGQSLEWGRDTGVDSVIASQPMLLSGGNVIYGGDDEVKRAGKGSRSFIGTKGSTAYIGVVHNANVAEVARVLKAMGLEYALNLDSGGSTALWSGGRYIVGPGRSTPFGILFVNK